MQPASPKETRAFDAIRKASRSFHEAPADLGSLPARVRTMRGRASRTFRRCRESSAALRA